MVCCACFRSSDAEDITKGIINPGIDPAREQYKSIMLESDESDDNQGEEDELRKTVNNNQGTVQERQYATCYEDSGDQNQNFNQNQEAAANQSPNDQKSIISNGVPVGFGPELVKENLSMGNIVGDNTTNIIKNLTRQQYQGIESPQPPSFFSADSEGIAVSDVNLLKLGGQTSAYHTPTNAIGTTIVAGSESGSKSGSKSANNSVTNENVANTRKSGSNGQKNRSSNLTIQTSTNFTMDAYLQRIFQLRNEMGSVMPIDLLPSTEKFRNNFIQYGPQAAEAAAESVRNSTRISSQKDPNYEKFDTGPDGGHSLFTDMNRRILPTLSKEFNVSKRSLHEMHRLIDEYSILKDHSEFNKEEMEVRHHFPLEGGFSSLGIDSKTGRSKIDDNLRFIIQLYHGFQYWLIDKDVVKIDRGHLLHPKVADIVSDLVVGTFEKKAFIAPAQKQGMVSDMEEYNNNQISNTNRFNPAASPGNSSSATLGSPMSGGGHGGERRSKGIKTGSGLGGLGCGPGGPGGVFNNIMSVTPKTDVLFFSGRWQHPTNDLWPGFIIQKKMDGVSSDLAIRVLKDPKYYPIFDVAVSQVALFETNDEYQVKVGIYPGVAFVVAARGILALTRHYQYSHNKKIHILFSRSIDPPPFLQECNEEYKKLIKKKGTVLGNGLSAWIIEQLPSEIEISTRVTLITWTCPMGNVENSSMVAKAFGKLGFSEISAVLKKVHKVCLDVKAGKA